MDFISQLDFFAFALLVAGFVLYASLTFLAQRGFLRPHFRRLSAYEALPQQVGEAVESGGRVHTSLAGNSIIQEDTATTLAGLAVLEAVSEQSAISEQSALGTTADPTTLPLLRDTMSRPAIRQGTKSEATAARLVALDPLSLAAGATSLISDENAAANVLVGSFEREAILMTEAGARLNLSQTVASDRLEGQAVAFVAADHPLIGEELFAAGAYLTDRPARLGSLAAQDILRWILVLGIVIGVVLRTLGRF